ncbi:protein odr-4 homolog [Hyla sarda]|uniref:protein odr-4 homolog n=1 Tax=Hyla sarda TaxID=327740 RepID=UPI0024C264F1|nr:protein odr-4 homolog [Hyla sarda]XP_056379613.1 protein odr-4 homolog [Hyla sarda]XP_056379614.1 protein odr-4 homolog [Hyla sarda]
MGRSYYVDEAVEKYFTKIIQQQKPYVTGLLIGHCSLLRDYVLLAVQTPQKEEPGEVPKQRAGPPRLDDIDEEWVSIHASQVNRMLPGGLLVVGVFLITSPELAKESQNTLRKLLFAVDKTSRKNRLWSPGENDPTDRAAVHVCSLTKKNTCRTFDISDPKSTAKPADWKYQNTPSSWLTIDCNVHVDLIIPLSSSATYQEKQKYTRQGLVQWAKELENAVILFNGQVKDSDGDLVEEQKKSRSSAHSSPQIISANILMTPNSVNRSTAQVQICKSTLRIQGVVKCRGYVSSSKPKVRDATQAIKRDLQNTLSDRCEILFEDIILNGSQHESEKEHSPLPQRIFIPVPGSTVMFCDYVFGDETEEDLENRIFEMLDQEVHYKALAFVEETNNRETHENEHQPPHDSSKPNQPSSPSNEERHTFTKGTSTKQQNIGLLMAAAVVVLAGLISLYYLNE